MPDVFLHSCYNKLQIIISASELNQNERDENTRIRRLKQITKAALELEFLITECSRYMRRSHDMRVDDVQLGEKPI